jgi:hypothetical protein
MNRIASAALILAAAISASGNDRPSPEPVQMFIATTGHIISINAEARTMMVRSSLHGRHGKTHSKATPCIANLDEYTVVTTDDTVFQDGADPIRFEDFKNGETISIHGLFRGATLKASRVAKWE